MYKCECIVTKRDSIFGTGSDIHTWSLVFGDVNIVLTIYAAHRYGTAIDRLRRCSIIWHSICRIASNNAVPIIFYIICTVSRPQAYMSNRVISFNTNYVTAGKIRIWFCFYIVVSCTNNYPQLSRFCWLKTVRCFQINNYGTGSRCRDRHHLADHDQCHQESKKLFCLVLHIDNSFATLVIIHMSRFQSRY